ncbi:MAG TPA: nucleoside 2-deoxyribosyltransferase [Acidimicrobiales bacterium]|nr:nucleoside 2-deoxyribosyltransferase [Acidimicrobiales bacterium]
MKVYVASPMGFFAAGRNWLLDVVHPAIVAAGHQIHDPWALPKDLQDKLDKALAMPLSADKVAALAAIDFEMGKRNAELIETADAVFAILDGTDVDSGTASEVGFAAGIGHRAVGLRTDFRYSCDNLGTTVNLQVEYFIRRHGGTVETDLDQAIAALTA